MGFSSQTMLGGITSRVHIDKYSTEELKKNVERELPQDDERIRAKGASNGGGAQVFYMLLCLRCGLKAEAMRIQRRILGKLEGKE